MIVFIGNCLYGFFIVQFGGRCDFKEVCLMYNEAGRISVSKQKTNTAPIEAILNMQPRGDLEWLGDVAGMCCRDFKA